MDRKHQPVDRHLLGLIPRRVLPLTITILVGGILTLVLLLFTIAINRHESVDDSGHSVGGLTIFLFQTPEFWNWRSFSILLGGAILTASAGIYLFILLRREAETRGLMARGTDELARGESLLRGVLDTAVDAIITIDAEGSILSFNRAAESIFGYSAEESIGRNVKFLMPEPYQTQHDGYLRNYLQTGRAKVIGIGREVEGQRKDGSVFPMRLAISEVRQGDQVMFTGLVRDITERKQIEIMKNEFISIVSHELRTPLTSIMGSLGLIQAGAAGPVPESMKEMLAIAHSNSERLVRLINDILDIEKIESGQLELRREKLELASLLAEAIEANRSYAVQYGVRFVLTGSIPDSTVMGDRDKLMQVLTNLLSNSAKFSPSGSEVEISLSRRDGSVRVEVADRGPGIPDEFQDRIFSKFVQADASNSRKNEGTGLGLSICKAIVESHGGKIGFHTSAGEGTTFYFDLPAHSPAERP